MAQDSDLVQKVRALVARDPRYRAEAYDFVREALEFGALRLGIRGHLTGKQLLEGFRALAIERYGPTAKMVLEHWGVTRTEDVGQIVFNMVEAGLLSKTESDRLDDFADGFDFDTVFEREYPWREDDSREGGSRHG